MNKSDLKNAIRLIHPKLSDGRDYTLAETAIATWTAPARFTQPTLEQLQAALDQRAAAVAGMEALRQALLAVFATLSAGDQAALDGMREKIAIRLRGGDVTGAREIIATISLVASLEPARAALLACFPTQS